MVLKYYFWLNKIKAMKAKQEILQVIEKYNLDAAELAEVISNIIVDNYGKHNYSVFKRVSNSALSF